MKSRDEPPRGRRRCFRCQTFYKLNFLVATCLKQKNTAMNKMSENAPESHECKNNLQGRTVNFRYTQTCVSGFNMRAFTLLLE